MRQAHRAPANNVNAALKICFTVLISLLALLAFSSIAFAETSEDPDNAVDTAIALQDESDDAPAIDEEEAAPADAAAQPDAVEETVAEETKLDGGEASADETPDLDDESESVSETAPAQEADDVPDVTAKDAADGAAETVEVTTPAAPAAPAKKATAAKEITSITVPNAVYTGSALKPDAVVKSGSTTLVKGQDYKLTYKNNVEEGTATVIAKGIGDYSGSFTQTFTIFGKATYKRGASKMPLYSYSLWTLKNAKLKVIAGNSVKVKGKKVTALRKGRSTIAVLDMVGNVVATKAVKVYAMSGNFKLRLASSSDLYLQIENGSKINGGNAIIATKASVSYQKFKLKAWSDKTYAIISSNSGKYVQVEKGSTENKANVKQWKKSGLPSQHWKIKVDAKNRLIFINKNSGKTLSIIKTTQADGANVLQYQENGRLNQKWVLSGGKRDYTVTTTTPAGSKNGSEAGLAIAMLAASISYSHVVYQGEGTGTKYYMKLCKALRSNGYYAKNSKQMQCNVPIAVSVRASGVDKKFPTTNKEIYQYMLKSSKWKCLGNYTKNESMLQPGDILIRIVGVTKYDGGSKTAATNHACIYVGKKIVDSVYRTKLKGTDADKGKPVSGAVFVSAHTSLKNKAKRSAACLEKASQAYADSRMIVFRYAG